jgi:hypothetical protein
VIVVLLKVPKVITQRKYVGDAMKRIKEIRLPDSWRDPDEIDLEDCKCRQWGEFVMMINDFIMDTEREKESYVQTDVSTSRDTSELS